MSPFGSSFSYKKGSSDEFSNLISRDRGKTSRSRSHTHKFLATTGLARASQSFVLEFSHGDLIALSIFRTGGPRDKINDMQAVQESGQDSKKVRNVPKQTRDCGNGNQF